MTKYFTVFCSAESKNGSKCIFYKIKTESLKGVFENTRQLLDSVKKSPRKEVINKILQCADR